jgi:hypothetical protein
MGLRGGKEKFNERFERQGSGRDRCVEGHRRGYRQNREQATLLLADLRACTIARRPDE